MITSVIAECSTTRYFTECSAMLQRDLIITGTKDCGDKYPLIYKNLDCTYDCSAGSFLDVANDALICTQCPSGSFNNGGGLIYGGDGISWNDALKTITNECWMREDYVNYRNYNCTPWTVDQNVLTSGGTIIDNAVYSAGLVINVNLVKAGSLTITYRKDTIRSSGLRVGSFSLYKDNVQIYFDNSIDQATWKRKVFQLEAGNQELYLEYSTLQAEGTQDMHAHIA